MIPPMTAKTIFAVLLNGPEEERLPLFLEEVQLDPFFPPLVLDDPPELPDEPPEEPFDPPLDPPLDPPRDPPDPPAGSAATKETSSSRRKMLTDMSTLGWWVKGFFRLPFYTLDDRHKHLNYI